MVLETTEDVIDFLAQTVERADDRTLPRGYGIFARAYHRFTLSLIAFNPSGLFQDPAWISDFDVRFARRYQSALGDPKKSAKPWSIAFRAADRDSKRAIRHLMLGINAHMSYDLVCVLLEGIVDDPTKRESDFLAVNRAIAQAVGSIQRLIEGETEEGPRLRIADALGLNVDELLTEETFTDWRSRSWTDAMEIRAGKRTLEQVEACVARRARMLSLLPF